ncbi:MAG: hypothetical protein AAF438_10965 [Pseudomonadota bacterium]
MWLPKPIYESLPFFYILTGVLFIAGAAYLASWLWSAPYYMVFGYLCVVSGGVLLLKRLSYRRNKTVEQQEADTA